MEDCPPERGQISHSDPLALSVGVADTKLNCAVKGATLLQLISLSADAHNGLHGISDPARAMFGCWDWLVGVGLDVGWDWVVLERKWMGMVGVYWLRWM